GETLGIEGGPTTAIIAFRHLLMAHEVLDLGLYNCMYKGNYSSLTRRITGEPEKDFPPQFLTEIVTIGGEKPRLSQQSLGGFLYRVSHFTVLQDVLDLVWTEPGRCLRSNH